MTDINDGEAWSFADLFDGSAPWDDQSGNGHHAAFPGGTNDPTFFDHDKTQGDNHFRAPGISNNDLTTPDSVALSITGDIDYRWVGIQDDYTPPTAPAIGHKYNFATNNREYRWGLATDGKIRFIWSEDGTSTAGKLHDKTSTVATGFTDGTLRGLRVTLDVNDGAGDIALEFWTLNNPGTDDPENAANWSKLGDTVTLGSTTSIFDGDTQVKICANIGGIHPMTVHRYLAYDGIDGTLVLDINPASLVGDTVTQAGTFTEDSAQAATVTINQSGTAELMRMVDRPAFQYDTDDRLEIPDDAALDYTHTDSFTFGLGFRVYDTSPAADAVLMAKKANLTTGDGYAGYLESADATSKGLLADGANEQTATSGNLTNGKAHTLIWVYDGSTTQAYLDGTASGSASADNVAADMANAVALVFASISGGGSYAQVEIWSYAVISQELTAGEVGTGAGTLHDSLLNQTAAVSATVTPAAIATTTTMPGPTVRQDQTLTPASITTTTSMTAPAVSAGSTLTPASIVTTTTFPSPRPTTPFALDLAVRAESVMELPVEAESAMELPVEAESAIEPSVEAESVIELPVRAVSVIELQVESE
ncbi:hypothetical protein LCGC14_0397270 [marine sediment metagenome]|uniref:LamG-like jellyroll fold domain-containing protein n=1 Tax=marine sediment metagenome TaxID=412755 RepID=A0A0F9T3K9_9ZZZZ